MDDTELPTKFLIDGIDRLGKSSLVKLLQEELGYHLVIHYDKPKVLSHLLDLADCIKRAEVSETDYDESYRNLSYHDLAKRLFQEETNKQMFELLKTKVPIIFDRTHLGEMVYAPMYRNYPGDYVYDLEKDLIESKPFSHVDDIRLILLISSNTDMLVDDGLSFDPAKKSQEQQLFINAFVRSKISNKVMVDVHNGNGGYKSYDQIFLEATRKNNK